MCAANRFGDTKDLAFATARFFVRQLRAAWKDSASREQRARALADLFASADMQDVFDALEVLASEVCADTPSCLLFVVLTAAAATRRSLHIQANVRNMIGASLPSMIVEVFDVLLPLGSLQIAKRSEPGTNHQPLHSPLPEPPPALNDLTDPLRISAWQSPPRPGFRAYCSNAARYSKYAEIPCIHIDMLTHLHLLTLHTLCFVSTITTSMQSDAIVDELQKSNTLCLLLDMVARPAPLLRVPHLRKRFATRA
jgi:hypothetical protein